MNDDSNVKTPIHSQFRATYLHKRDTSQFSRRFSEIGIEPQFVQKIRLMLLSERRPPCCVRDVINNILEQFFKDNNDIIDCDI